MEGADPCRRYWLLGEMLRFLCWEGLELLVLGDGRWWRSLGHGLSSCICTLEELRRRACAQPSQKCHPRGVSGICPSRGLLPHGPHGMAPWPLPWWGYRSGRGSQSLPPRGLPGVPRGWEPPWDWAGLRVAGGCLVAVGYRPHPAPACCPSHSLSAPTVSDVRVVNAVLCQALLDAGAGAWSAGSRMGLLGRAACAEQSMRPLTQG